MKFEFITNEAVVKNNKSLKNQGQGAVEMEFERHYLGEVLKIEAYPPGTHFKITVETIEDPIAQPPKMDFAPKKERTIYQKFKDKCLEYSGEEYYSRIKKHLGVTHVKDLEKKYGPEIVAEILKLQIAKINQKMGVPGVISVEVGSAYQHWKTLFDALNYPKNEMQEKKI